MLALLFAFLTLVAQKASGCACYENGAILSCDYFADSYSLRHAECKNSAKTLIWIAPDCVQNVKVHSVNRIYQLSFLPKNPIILQNVLQNRKFHCNKFSDDFTKDHLDLSVL